MEKNKLILVDGSSYLFRAFFAHQGSFVTRNGKPTGAAHIMTRMIKKLMRSYPDDNIVVVMDAKGPTFRNEMFSEYKANRQSMPKELAFQIPYIHRIVQGLNLPLIVESGVEADDVIGSYAIAAEKEGIEVIICTGDKDLTQVVSDKITLLDTMHDRVTTVLDVKEKYGLGPEKMADFLALKGDTADNIPGVPGCGDRKAELLLTHYKDVDDIIAHAANLKEETKISGIQKISDWIVANTDQLILSKKLTLIKTDLTLPIPLSELKRLEPNYEALQEVYGELEFTRFIEEDRLIMEQLKAQAKEGASVIGDSATKANDEAFATNDKECASCKQVQIEKVAESLIVIRDKESFDKVVKAIEESKFVAFKYIVSDSTQLIDSKILALALAYKEGETFVVPFPLDEDIVAQNTALSFADITKSLQQILENKDIFKLGYNIKEELIVSTLNGIDSSFDYDIMLASHLVNNTVGHSLEQIAAYYLDQKLDLATLKFTKKNKDQYEELVCARSQAIITSIIRLYAILDKELVADKTLQEIFTTMEMPFAKVLASMELNGAYLSKSKVEAFNADMKAKLLAVTTKIHELTNNADFNISSPKQLAKVLFEDMALPYPKKVKGNAYSTAEDILTAIADEHEVINLVLRYRTLSKLISTYAEKLPQLISKRTGRIHTSFNQTGTRTGRLSSSDPNLQNIPAHSDEGKELRACFVAREGYSLVAIDYSQIELRLMAHFSQDPKLIEAFKEGQDIHAQTAANILNKKIEDVTAEERSHAKATNFGLIYGMGAHGLANQTKMSMALAKKYIEEFFKHYPSIKDYMDKIVAEGSKQGYIETLCHHKLRFPELMSQDVRVISMAKRAAINAPMQGSASEIIKKAMLSVAKYINSLESKDDIYLLLQVHDELIFEIKDDKVDFYAQKLSEIMNNIVELRVPLCTSVDSSKCWQ